MTKQSDKSQIEKFKQAAREHGCEDDSAADVLMGRLAHTAPEPKKPKPAAKEPKQTKPGD